MLSLAIGDTAVRECEQCMGLWLNVAAFEKLCSDREQQSTVLGTASRAPTHAVGESTKVKYVPCPECLQLMNRINFARCSGVIVDICKGHGTWFDRDELSKIVEFIRGGGLEAARLREKEQIKEERRRLWEEQVAKDRQASGLGLKIEDDHRLTGMASARGLLKFLLD
jgi:Zn-finger nucleic acid-binding protein